MVRELGYSPRPSSPAPAKKVERTKQAGGDRGCLEVLMESVKEVETHLRIFLNSQYSHDAMARIFEEMKGRHPAGITDMEAITSAILAVVENIKKNFPITFTIEDACLTNSDAIWLAKHVYL
jgi:hypothetical protein